MKKLIIVLAIFLITVSIAQSQSFKNIPNESNSEYTSTEDSYISFRLKTVYTNVSENSNFSYYDDGIGVTFSLQIDLGKMISLYGDFNYSSLKYTNNNKAHSNPPDYFSGRKPSLMLIFGTKLYPKKSRALIYLKTGLGILTREDAIGFPPIFNAGIGYELKLSKVFNVFAEGEAVYYAGTMGNYSGKYPETLDLTFGLGGSINIENLFK